MSSPNPLQEFYGDNTLFEDDQYINDDPELAEVEAWIRENI